MKPHKGICKECNQEKWISNARCLCDKCVYKINHNGLTPLEVIKEKQKNKTINSPYLKQFKKPVKSTQATKEKRRELLNKDRETYLKVFNSKPNYCEECFLKGIVQYLPSDFENDEGNINFISQYSHILSKSAFPEYRHNPENFNRLCLSHHQHWEFFDKTKMKIYEPNQLIIEKIRNK